MDNKTLVKVLIATGALIVGFMFGSLWKENKLLKGDLTSKPTTGAPSAAAPTAPTTAGLSKMPAVTEADHVRGNPDAKILLVEYSDYECPFCNRFHPTMQEVLKEYGNRVAWVYRHFPLSSLHPQAQISAEASECVAKLAGNDVFWQYSDRLFEEVGVAGGDALADEKLVTYATELGVNATGLQNCLDSGEMTAAVEEDATGGRAAGISGTPGTILVTSEGDFELISGALSLEQVKTIIEQYL
ncbi:MAG TPA: thioredoxin domain-containing protein [Patescibacteria group bacterium]|jgi:protein-disulfide isomerase